MAKYEGPERRTPIPDWATRLLVALVAGVASAVWSMWNDNIITKQDVITIKATIVKSEEEIASLRSEVNQQNNHNRLILDKLDQIVVNSSRRK